MFGGPEIADKLPKDLGPMIGAGFMAFFGVMQALDPEFDAEQQPDGTIVQYPIWPIQDDEARKLGNATATQLATLPAARRKSIAKFLNEYAPGIILASAIYEVAGPRLRFSIAAKKARRDRTLAQQTAAANAGRAPGAPANSRDGAARAPHRPVDGVSPARGDGDDGSRAYAGANAHRNGAASAFTTDGGLG